MSHLSLNLTLPLIRFSLDVKANIPLNTITAIFGYSGAGKTSLLRAISGLEPQTKGVIQYQDEYWLNTTASPNTPHKNTLSAHKRRIGMVFQDNRLFTHLTVEQNLAYAIKRRKSRTIDYNEVIRLTNIAHLLLQLPETLSGGEQQRVAIARAVLNEPSVLLLDEPFSALDVHHKTDLITLLQSVHTKYQLPIVYVSHSLDDIQQLADNTLVLDKGQVVLFDKTHTVIHQLNEKNMIPQQTCLTLPVDLALTAKIEQYGLIALSLKNKKKVSTLSFSDHETRNQLPTENTIYISKSNSKLPYTDTLSCYINANEISLSLSSATDSSVMNQLPAQIENITIINTKALIKARCDEHVFYTLISLFSLEKLGLHANKTVYLHFKASSVKTLNDYIDVHPK